MVGLVCCRQMANGMIFKSWLSFKSIQHSLNTLLKDGILIFQQLLDILINSDSIGWNMYLQCIYSMFNWVKFALISLTAINKCNNIYANRNANTNTHTNRNTDRDKNTITNVLNSWASISPVDAFRPPLPHRHHLFSIPPTFLAEKYKHILQMQIWTKIHFCE